MIKFNSANGGGAVYIRSDSINAISEVTKTHTEVFAEGKTFLVKHSISAVLDAVSRIKPFGIIDVA